MKKIVLAVVFCGMFLGCNEPNSLYSEEDKECLNVVYATSCDMLNMTQDAHATDAQKIAIIRRADLKDEAGDILPEMWEYDVVAKIIWPRGYGE